MITQRTNDNMVNEYYGLSTDTKPTNGVPNASVFLEMDTSKLFIFDEAGVQWYEIGD